MAHDTLVEQGVQHHLLCVVCMEDGGVQCVIKHCVKHHLPYVVCGCKMEGVVHDTLLEHSVEHQLIYVLCVKDGADAVCKASISICCVWVENGGCGA